MLIIVTIGLIIWLAILSSRISNLEKHLSLKPQQPRPQNTPQGQSAQMMQQTSVHPAGQSMQAAQVQGQTHATGMPSNMHQTMPVAASTAPRSTVAPAQPKHVEDGEFVWAKWLAKAGVAAIVAGVAFFLKLAIDYGWIGVSGRVAIGILVGLIGLVLGQILRPKYKSYSDVLIGGGLAALYVTIYFAYHFYHLIGAPVALGLMVGVTAVSVVMSIVDKAETLARIGIIGGFLAPLLISSGEANLLELFTYMLVLDLGVLAIAFRQKWHTLNFIAFVGTFILYSAGLLSSFTEMMRVPVLLYTTVFFLLFLAVSIMHHLVRKEKSYGSDIMLLSLNALWYGLAVYTLVVPIARDYLGFYMLGIAIIYAVVAFIAFLVDKSDRTLNQFLTSICIAFLTVAVPMQFDGSWITIIWFFEAVILFAIDYSLKGKNLYPLGAIVFGFGLFRYFGFDKFESVNYENFTTVINSRFLMLAVIVAIAATLGYIARKAGHSIVVSKEDGITEGDLHSLHQIGTFFFVVTHLLAIYLVTTEVHHHYQTQIVEANQTYTSRIDAYQQYNPSNSSDDAYLTVSYGYSEKEISIRNRENVAVSIAWAIYAGVLLVFGFIHKSRGLRIAGLVFIFVTLVKVFFDIWSFGGIYRVIGSVSVGLIALIGSFLYAKYKDRIKSVVAAAIIGLIVAGSVAGALPVSLQGSLLVADAQSDTRVGAQNGAQARSQTNIQSGLQYMAQIETPRIDIGDGAKVISVDVPIHILPKTSIDDIRIFDNQSVLVPHIVLDGSASANSDPSGEMAGGSIAAAISNSTTKGGESTAILDVGKAGILHSEIDLDVAGAASFARGVKIFGSDTMLPVDSAAWRTITTTGYIYSYSDAAANLSAMNTKVSYVKNSSRYLKVVISPELAFADRNAASSSVSVSSGASKAPLSILGARITSIPSLYASHDMKTQVVNPFGLSIFENNQEQSTEITIDLGDPGIFSSGITLKLANPDQQFIRRAVVQHRDAADLSVTGGDAEKGWSKISETTLFNVNKSLFAGTNLTLTYPEVKSRFLRVVIFNKDDQPVSFSKNSNDIQVESKVRTLLFDAEPGKTYTMYFGNPKLARAQYDYAFIKSYENVSTIDVELGQVKENPSYIPPAGTEKPWSERNRVLLNSMLVVLVLVVGGIVYMYVKKAKRPTDKNRSESDPEPESESDSR